jgi:putative transposase
VDYQAELKASGILISMSGRGNCFDNAMVETFFKTLKSELVWRTSFDTRADAAAAIGRYIDGFYNPVRRHSALDFTSPAQFERMATT